MPNQNDISNEDDNPHGDSDGMPPNMSESLEVSDSAQGGDEDPSEDSDKEQKDYQAYGPKPYRWVGWIAGLLTWVILQNILRQFEVWLGGVEVAILMVGFGYLGSRVELAVRKEREFSNGIWKYGWAVIGTIVCLVFLNKCISPNVQYNGAWQSTRNGYSMELLLLEKAKYNAPRKDGHSYRQAFITSYDMKTKDIWWREEGDKVFIVFDEGGDVEMLYDSGFLVVTHAADWFIGHKFVRQN